MKSIEEIYGKEYMSVRLATNIFNSSAEAIKILKLRRTELVYKSIHDKRLPAVTEALSFWEEINTQYKEYLK